MPRGAVERRACNERLYLAGTFGCGFAELLEGSFRDGSMRRFRASSGSPPNCCQ